MVSFKGKLFSQSEQNCIIHQAGSKRLAECVMNGLAQVLDENSGSIEKSITALLAQKRDLSEQGIFDDKYKICAMQVVALNAKASGF